MIKFAFFDVGGVVINDFSGTNNWDELKREIGVKPEDNQRFDIVWEQLEEELNKGKDIELLIPELNNEMGLNIPKDYDLLDSFVSRFTKNESIWPIISEAKKKYQIGLLTNMYPRMFDAIIEKDILPPVEFDVIIDSSKVGAKKPNKAIYDICEERTGHKAGEVFFTDNSSKNLIVPREIGWQVFLYHPENVVESNKQLQKYIHGS